MSSLMDINKICEFCGSDFIAHKTTTRYCSLKCNSKAYKQRIRQEKIKTTEKRAVVIEKNKSLGKIKDKEFFQYF